LVLRQESRISKFCQGLEQAGRKFRHGKFFWKENYQLKAKHESSKARSAGKLFEFLVTFAFGFFNPVSTYNCIIAKCGFVMRYDLIFIFCYTYLMLYCKENALHCPR
jgi:hypothetical protein